MLRGHVQKSSPNLIWPSPSAVCPMSRTDPTLSLKLHTTSQFLKLIRHGDSRTEGKEPVSILERSRAPNRVTDDQSESVSRSCGCSLQFTSSLLISGNVQKFNCERSQIGNIRCVCLWTMWRKNCGKKTTGPGHQPNACMSFDSPLCTPNEGCACVDLFLRHPRCAWTPE
jgi:hypothetical protein